MKLNGVEIFVDEIRLLFHQASALGEQLHQDESISMSMRAVLEMLHRGGKLTVPEMARKRNVSRQHIQSIVNSLVDTNLVCVTDNPAHKRSSLIVMTEKGSKTISRMREREQTFFEYLQKNIPDIDFSELASELAEIRKNLANEAQRFQTQLAKKGA